MTGSNHCALVPFWAERLGKRQLRARQISARGGELRLALQENRVLMAGQAVTLWQGSGCCQWPHKRQAGGVLKVRHRLVLTIKTPRGCRAF